jgi:hypothetical protein
MTDDTLSQTDPPPTPSEAEVEVELPSMSDVSDLVLELDEVDTALRNLESDG